MSDRLIPELKVAWSTARKEAITNIRYPLWVIFWAIMPIFSLAPLVIQGRALVGGRFSESFAGMSGNADYITFNIIGSTLYAYVMSSLWGMGLSLRREQWSGTLEALMISPVSKFSILLGKAISDSAFATFSACVQFVLASLIFGAAIKIESLGLVVGIVLLMILALYGIGFVLSGIVMTYKEPGTMLNFVNTLVSIICPVNYPIRALVFVLGTMGNYLLVAGLMFPLTQALEATRALLLPGFSSFMSVSLAALTLVVMSVLLITGGALLFNRVDTAARRKGILGEY